MSSDDSFCVAIQNLTTGSLTPGATTIGAGGWGEFGPGGDPVTVPPYSGSGPIPTAFSVIGKIASGPQGTVQYLVNTNANLLLQFNSNAGGQPGDYFYAGIQPASTGADTSGIYAAVNNFSIPTGYRSTSFAPVVTVYQNDGSPYVVNPLPYPPTVGNGGDFLWIISVINNTGELMTLNQVVSPLNNTPQPAFATTIPPYDPQQPTPYLVTSNIAWNTAGATAATIQDPPPPPPSDLPAIAPNDIRVSYNLAGGTVVTITYTIDNTGAAYANWSGAGTSKYTFSSTNPVVGLGSATLTVTLGLIE